MLKPLNLFNRATNLLRVNDLTYQGPAKILSTTASLSSTPSLVTWHKRLGHINFPSLKAFLRRLEILFVDDAKDHICDSCNRAKATKVYNREPKKRAQRPYQFVHTDLVGPIKPLGFSGERYFFTFTDDCTRLTETYTASKKSDWLKCLKTYHSLCRTRSKEEHPIERLRSDYGAELQSHNADEWMQREGITFEPSAPYSQEQNGVSERMGRTIMDMTRATILEGNINDELWPELVLAMTYIKNNRPTRALANNISPHEAHFHEQPDLSHLRILGSTVYVLIHEEERSMKSEKWAPRALKGILVGFDGHTIYRVHIKDQNKVIQVKDLRIFEDYETKESTELPDYSESLSTFQGFLHTDEEKERELPVPQAGRKVKNAREEEQSSSGSRKSRKVTENPPTSTKARAGDAEPIKQTLIGQEPEILQPNKGSRAGFKPKDAEQRSRTTGRTIKLTTKAQEAKVQAEHNPTKNHPRHKPEVKRLIAQLAQLLDNWEEEVDVLATHTKDLQLSETIDPLIHAEDPAVLLATKIHSANAGDLDHFVGSTQFDVEEPETYARAMQGPNSTEWARAMEEELDQLRKNDTWILVPRSEIEPGHRPLGGKWVYKVKRDVNGEVARFKARWVVKGYLQQFGVDFDQTFAAVVKPMAFRVLFAVAAFLDLDIEQMDVKTAFLYGLIDQLVYVDIPKGSETESNRDMVCKLLKALYGLKQSPRLWYERLSDFLLQKLGLARINVDHSIFVTGAGLNGPVVSTFVDDIKIMAPKRSEITQRVKMELTSAFSIVDMSPISFYLGLKVERDQEKRTIKLS